MSDVMSDTVVGRVLLVEIGGPASSDPMQSARFRPVIQLITSSVFEDGPWTCAVLSSLASAQRLRAELDEAIRVMQVEVERERLTGASLVQPEVAASGSVTRAVGGG